MALVLILCRHGQAVEGSGGERDHARVLTALGAEQARSTGAQIHAGGWRPTLALVSDAARTKGTWRELVAGGVGEPLEMQHHHSIYTGGSRELSALFDAVDAIAHSCVIMVGHNPQISRLATELAGAYVAFNTGEAAVLSTELESWAEAGSAHAGWRLKRLIKP